MYFRQEQMEERQRQLRMVPERFPMLMASSSLKNNIEINSAEAGKGKALMKLAALLGIEREETAAFGDGLNDADLLLATGRGCAVANAEKAVKEAADVIVESNNDAGVGKEIFRLISSPGRVS